MKESDAGKLVVGLILAGVLTAGTSLLAQTLGPRAYHALPSWDLTLPASQRFIVLSNFNSEAVLDRETGLVWERRPTGASWPLMVATDECGNKMIGGRRGWRLPYIHELASLLDTKNPSHLSWLPAGHPFEQEGPSSIFYSASRHLIMSDHLRVLNIQTGGVFPVPQSFNEGRVWCVRGSASLAVH